MEWTTDSESPLQLSNLFYDISSIICPKKQFHHHPGTRLAEDQARSGQKRVDNLSALGFCPQSSAMPHLIDQIAIVRVSYSVALMRLARHRLCNGIGVAETYARMDWWSELSLEYSYGPAVWRIYTSTGMFSCPVHFCLDSDWLSVSTTQVAWLSRINLLSVPRPMSEA